MKKTSAIILGAGRGVRMESDLPKVFHMLAGKPLLQHVIEKVQKIGVDKIYVVVGHKKEIIIDYFKDWPITFIEQKEQLGTGHAVKMAAPYLKDFDGNVLVLAGDVPLLSSETLASLVKFHEESGSSATDLTAELPDAGAYGRIIRSASGELLKIVEKKDATEEELKIREINTGTFCFDSKDLFASLEKVKPLNVQKEYYLTDTIEILRGMGKKVSPYLTQNHQQTLGINTKAELAMMETLVKG